MLGGPFMDFQGSNCVEEIKALRDRTVKDCAELLELSKAITQLDELLASKAKGFCIQDLYAEVPGPLQGYVELVYDLNNHPSFRLLEPLLYKSRYYDRSLQSLMLSTISKDDRPFVLSTPRLSNGHTVELNLPFENESIDALFQMKTKASCFNCIADEVGLTPRTRHCLNPF